MKEKIEACFKRIQTLEIQPTLGNTEKILQTLYDLRDVYNELNREGDGDGRPAADTEP